MATSARRKLTTCSWLREGAVAISHQYVRHKPDQSAEIVTNLRNQATGPKLAEAIAVERAAAQVVAEMTKIHGGVWKSKVNHERRVVLVWCLD